jgi:hypothetical protein
MMNALITVRMQALVLLDLEHHFYATMIRHRRIIWV